MTTLNDQYDVMIVGSGPAGAGAAKALSGSGLRVLIVERAKLPRYKMCSGIVFPSARKIIEDNFGYLPKELMCNPETTKGNRIFVTNEAPMVDLPFSVFDNGLGLEKEGFNTRRADLDHWLCSQTDADLVDDCCFHGFKKQGDGYVVELVNRGMKNTVRVKFLIGADGTGSKVRRTAFPDFDANVGLLPNYEESYVADIDLEPGWLYMFFDRRITGYFATVFHKDGQVVIVTGTNQRESVKECFSYFIEHLKIRHGLKVHEKTTANGIVLTDMSAKRNYCLGTENLILVGEAGGFLRGGEGITSALMSGMAAGEAVIQSLKTGAHAIGFFRKLAAAELAVCEEVHNKVTTTLGYNVFVRGSCNNL